MPIDLLNLDWWQTLVGLIGVLGLSPAPWLLGLATGRLQFTAPAERREAERLKERDDHFDALAAEKDRVYSEMKESRDYYREARLVEKGRADELVDQVVASVEVAKASMQALTAIDQAARDVTEGKAT